VSLRHLPFHRVLHRPSQFLGGEREPALMTLIIAVDQKLADRSPLLRLASEKLTPGAGAPRHSSVDPVALRDQGDACSIIINFGGCVVATAEQLRVWAAEARTWAEQATSREMAAAMHRLAVDLYELAHVQAPDAVTDSPDSPR
jgi:hypothetical protein